MDERILKRVVVEAVHETLATLGFDVENPSSMQADLAHLHRWRTNVEAIQRTSFVTMAGTLVTGLMAALWIGIQALLSKH